MNKIKRCGMYGIVFLTIYFNSLFCCFKQEECNQGYSYYKDSTLETASVVFQSISLMAAIYPIVRGVDHLRWIADAKMQNHREGYKLDDLKKLGTIEFQQYCLQVSKDKYIEFPACSVDLNKLSNLIEEVIAELKIDPKRSSDVRYGFCRTKLDSLECNAAASSNYICFFYSAFCRFSSGKQKFIIAHEFSHILEHHGVILGTAKIVLPLLSLSLVQALRYILHSSARTGEHAKIFEPLLFIVDSGILSNAGIHWRIYRKLIGSLSSYLEKRADLKAAYSLDNAASGISLSHDVFYLSLKNSKTVKNDVTVPHIEQSSLKNKSSKLKEYFSDSIRKKKIELDTSLDFQKHPSQREQVEYLTKRYMELYDSRLHAINE
jgi:hypothetical protein